MVAVIAALPREITGLVKGKRADAELLKRGIHLYRGKDAVVVAAGMGSTRAALGVEVALAEGPITDITSIGLAGACVPGAFAGAVFEANEVIDARTGERYPTSVISSSRYFTFASIETIASVNEKKRLHETYGVSVVDMEAATVARLALAHKAGFRAIKGISDEHDFELESLSRFTGRHGSFRTGAFALHTALRPHRWKQTITLGRNSARALAALTQAMQLTFYVHGVSF